VTCIVSRRLGRRPRQSCHRHRRPVHAPPESIRALADRLDRGVKETAGDVNLLADYEIVYFEQDGRAKQPYVPYDTVKIEVEIDARAADDTDRALASG
jgi:predicted transcriptional regulator